MHLGCHFSPLVGPNNPTIVVFCKHPALLLPTSSLALAPSLSFPLSKYQQALCLLCFGLYSHDVLFSFSFQTCVSLVPTSPLPRPQRLSSFPILGMVRILRLTRLVRLLQLSRLVRLLRLTRLVARLVRLLCANRLSRSRNIVFTRKPLWSRRNSTKKFIWRSTPKLVFPPNPIAPKLAMPTITLSPRTLNMTMR